MKLANDVSKSERFLTARRRSARPLFTISFSNQRPAALWHVRRTYVSANRSPTQGKSETEAANIWHAFAEDQFQNDPRIPGWGVGLVL
ncbi:hypothetical protein [Cupriavidus sp. TA19]|uniref:hypothetical protein n=1 Tax=Cupriavidus sp. TA19 TaxID=701108 RepID=UPI00295E5CE5|nr:hypothetical protein [Cupriavidus sp. TA19]